MSSYAATPDEIMAKAESGNLDAMAYASEFLRYGGNGWPKDALKSRQFAKIAAEKGNPEGAVAYYNYAPEEQREKLLRNAAEMGHERAFVRLAALLNDKASFKNDEASEKIRSEAYAWAQLSTKSKDKVIVTYAKQLVDRIVANIQRVEYARKQSKKSSGSLGSLPDLSKRAQEAQKALEARMAKKFPAGFPMWPPDFDKTDEKRDGGRAIQPGVR